MLRNYLKIAYRNLRKNTFYSFLNIFGLSLGLASCLLITLYVVNEMSYDRFFENADRIYRIDANLKFGGPETKVALVPDPMAYTLKKDYPQVEAATRLRGIGSHMVRRNEEANNLTENNVAFADSTFFQVFSVSLLTGNPKTALTEPYTMVLSERGAEKYFGSDDPVGKSLLLDNDRTYRVTAVMGTIPTNSHFHDLEMLLSMASWPESREGAWLSHNFATYITLEEGAQAAVFEKNFDTVLEKYIGPAVMNMMGATLEDMKKSGNYLNYSLIPLTDIHLYSNRTGEFGVSGNIQYVYIFSIVAIFLLLIACVNFMNLATARSASRAREVGVRKALGSERSALVLQFLLESMLLSFISVGLSLVLASLALPLFNQLAGQDLTLPVSSPVFWGILLLAGGVVGLLAGSYPAFLLSGFQTIKVLKGGTTGAGGSSWLRNGLVVFQFMISVMLIVGTLVIYRQLNYIQTKALGFNKEEVLILDNTYALGNQANAFRQEMLALPNVEIGTVTSFLPTPSTRSTNSFFPEGKSGDKGTNMQYWGTDYDYVKTLGMEIVAGRDFSRDFPSDSSGILINETAVKLLGFSDPIGKRVTVVSGEGSANRHTYKIVGVVKNFHFESLRSNIGALSMVLSPGGGSMAFRMKTDNVQASIEKTESLWKKMAPGQPFAYRFMNDEFDNVYRSEARVGRVFITFALLSILIGCLGLFGLVTFTAEQRVKEIGVRKVLGASVGSIVALLSKDFLKLVLVAIVIASPIAWYAMNTWLEDFAYKIDISWWIFALAGLLAVGIALLTVSFQAVKAALMNPVKSLRSE